MASPDHVIDIPASPNPTCLVSLQQAGTISSMTSGSSCIYRVPNNSRKYNEHAYTPRYVSIGPFHFGKPEYSQLENDKVKIMNILLSETGKSFDYLLKEIAPYEDIVRASYNGHVDLDSETFLRMMLMDSAFLLFTLHHSYFIKDRERHLSISLPTALAIRQDLLLFENQLPSSLLHIVYNRLYEHANPELLSKLLMRLLPEYLHEHMMIVIISRNLAAVSAAHFVELLRLIELSDETYRDLNTTDTLGTIFSPTPIYTASKLRKAGVRLSGHRFDTKFSSDGALQIKGVTLSQLHLLIFKNIMAFELCVSPNQQFVADQLVLLEMLVRGGIKDEKVLSNNGIIYNRLDGKSAQEVLRELTATINIDLHPFSLQTLCFKVNFYCHRPLALLRTYLDKISVKAGVQLIGILAFIQTVCSILALAIGK